MVKIFQDCYISVILSETIRNVMKKREKLQILEINDIDIVLDYETKQTMKVIFVEETSSGPALRDNERMMFASPFPSFTSFHPNGD